VGQLLSFNRKGLRLAEARHHRSSRLHLILDSVQMCCLVKIAHYATEPREESVARQVPLWELEAPVAFAADLFNRAGMGWVEEPWLVESHTTVIIPVDDHVIFVRWLNRTISSGRLSEVPKPSTRSPGCSSWSVAESSASGGFRARPESAVAPGYDKGSWRACAVWGAVYWPQVPDRQATDHPG